MIGIGRRGLLHANGRMVSPASIPPSLATHLRHNPDGMHIAYQPAWVETRVLAAERHARSVLREVGLSRFADDLDSEAAWLAFNRAIAKSKGPKSPGVRGQRARSCLLLVRLIRAAANDGDVDDVRRYLRSLCHIAGDSLSEAEHIVCVARRRQTARNAARRALDAACDTRWEQWAAKFEQLHRDYPDESKTTLVSWIARAYQAKPDTVRKAMRKRQRRLKRALKR
jgi:hypothetical protein